MAENAVYLSSIEHSKPTIFELWAEESFLASLQPAFRLLCDFIKSKLPQGQCGPLEFIFKWPDESFLVFNLIMQTTYLNRFSASFSESFYGLKRVNSFSPNKPLSTKAKLLSLIELVGAPYLSLKFKTIVDYVIFQNPSERRFGKSGLDLLNTYKIANVVLKMVKLYYYVTYLSGTTSHHSAFHQIAGLQLIHHNRPLSSWKDLYTSLLHAPNKTKLLGPLAFKIISQFFELSAFSLQFINWWNNSDLEALKFNNRAVPEPLEPVDSKEHCPICDKPWVNEVALSTSGIVYCFSCITKVLADTGVCPVTSLPFTMNDLIRLYPSVS